MIIIIILQIDLTTASQMSGGVVTPWEYSSRNCEINLTEFRKYMIYDVYNSFFFYYLGYRL